MGDGFLIVPDVLNVTQRDRVLDLIRSLDSTDARVMASKDFFAIRNVCGVLPELLPLVCTPVLHELIRRYCGEMAFLTKSIYFDKPALSNWFVPYHQDISISVQQRHELDGFMGWTAKHGVIGVIPPRAILERTLTIRVHLDDADEDNGALRVLPGSHSHGILRDPVDLSVETTCTVKAGGAMLMRPLLFHASSRSIDDRPRRVFHMEFNDMELPPPLQWAERMPISRVA